MRVERRDLTVGVVGEVRELRLEPATERGAGVLVPTDQRLLLPQRRAVPPLDEHADDPHHVVRAADRPRGFAVTGGHPHVLVHQRPVTRVEVGRAVLEPEQVAHLCLAGFGGAAPVEAVDHPVQHEVVTGAPEELAQGEDRRIRRVGGDAEQQIAVRALRVQPVVGHERHPLELKGLAGGEAVAIVEEGRPHRDDDGEVGGRRLLAEVAGLERRQPLVGLRVGPTRHQTLDLVAEVLEGVGQLGAVGPDHAERGHQA